jgi:hypothetical protein
MFDRSVAETEVGERVRELTMYVSRKQRSHATLRLQEMNVKEGVGTSQRQMPGPAPAISDCCRSTNSPSTWPATQYIHTGGMNHARVRAVANAGNTESENVTCRRGGQTAGRCACAWVGAGRGQGAVKGNSV